MTAWSVLPVGATKMLVRVNASECLVMWINGLTLELTFEEGATRGVWLFGDHWLFEITAAQA